METKIQNYKHIKTQADAVIHFLQHLDIEMIDAILEENRTYQDFEKVVFIQKLGEALNEFIQDGDTYLNLHDGFCNSKSCCNFKCSGYTFIGNASGNYFDLLFEIKEGIVHDITECSTFKSIDENTFTSRYILIDKMEEPF
jgi:hypothetical protein